MTPLRDDFRGRSNSSTPPRAVYDDLNSAHSNITGRAKANWPRLTPGWAGDQPTPVNHPQSTPISAAARITSSGNIIESPLASRSTRTPRSALTNASNIRDIELGTSLPNVSPEEALPNARITRPEYVDDSASLRCWS